MGLLAYDPERVSRLRQQLIDASLDLRAVRCTDPAAFEAMRAVRGCIAQLDNVWLPFVTRLLDSDPLAGLVRKSLHINSLDQSLIRVMAEGYGWAVQVDPLSDDTSQVTVEEARALAVALNTTEPMGLASDPDQLRWLAQQLAIIGRDPALSAEFLANFHNWDTLPYILADQRASSYTTEYKGRTTSRQLDPVFDGLMAIWRTTLSTETLRAGTRASITDLLPQFDEDADPYVQALMLRSLRLDPTTLATVTNELLRRWLDTKVEGGASRDLAVNQGPNVADLLLPRIAENSTTSAYFLSLIGDRPALLFQTLEDPDIGYRIALAGTDPSHVQPAEAERAVLSILEYFGNDLAASDLNDDGQRGEYGPFLGQLVAPWLLQFSGSNGDWAANDETKAHLLSVALDDEQALRALTAASQRIADGLAHSLTTAADDSWAIQRSLQIGGLLSLIGQLVVNEHIADANERSTFLWDLTWTVLAAATNFVPGGAVANVAAGSGVMMLEEVLAPHFLGPTGDEVRHDGEKAMDVALTITASVMMTATFQSWQDDDRIGADATPPPLPIIGGCTGSEYRKQFEKWAGELPGGVDGDMADSAFRIVDSFIGVGQAGEHCGELSH